VFLFGVGVEFLDVLAVVCGVLEHAVVEEHELEQVGGVVDGGEVRLVVHYHLLGLCPADQLGLDLHAEVGLTQGDGPLVLLHEASLTEVFGAAGVVEPVHDELQLLIVDHHVLERLSEDHTFAFGLHYLHQLLELATLPFLELAGVNVAESVGVVHHFVQGERPQGVSASLHSLDGYVHAVVLEGTQNLGRVIDGIVVESPADFGRAQADLDVVQLHTVFLECANQEFVAVEAVYTRVDPHVTARYHDGLLECRVLLVDVGYTFDDVCGQEVVVLEQRNQVSGNAPLGEHDLEVLQLLRVLEVRNHYPPEFDVLEVEELHELEGFEHFLALLVVLELLDFLEFFVLLPPIDDLLHHVRTEAELGSEWLKAHLFNDFRETLHIHVVRVCHAAQEVFLPVKSANFVVVVCKHVERIVLVHKIVHETPFDVVEREKRLRHVNILVLQRTQLFKLLVDHEVDSFLEVFGQLGVGVNETAVAVRLEPGDHFGRGVEFAGVAATEKVGADHEFDPGQVDARERQQSNLGFLSGGHLLLHTLFRHAFPLLLDGGLCLVFDRVEVYHFLFVQFLYVGVHNFADFTNERLHRGEVEQESGVCGENPLEFG